MEEERRPAVASHGTPIERVRSILRVAEHHRQEERNALDELRVKVRTKVVVPGGSKRIWLIARCNGLASGGGLCWPIMAVVFDREPDFGMHSMIDFPESNGSSALLRAILILRGLLEAFEGGDLKHVPGQADFDLADQIAEETASRVTEEE